MVLVQAFLNLLLILISLALGAYILFFGRRALWATLGIIALAVTANLLAEFATDATSGWELVQQRSWILVAIIIGAGVIGIAIGHYRQDFAVSLIGFAAGADIALWFRDIITHGVTSGLQLSEGAAVAAVVGLIIVGGLLGLWLIRVERVEFLILITMFIGAELINDTLGLSSTSSWSAIVILSLGLAGVLVQFTSYLRELKAESQLKEPEPALSSVAYFQDLELDL